MSTRDKTVAELRADGFAIVIFTPSELLGADVGRVEDRLCSLGNEVIEILRTEARPDED